MDKNKTTSGLEDRTTGVYMTEEDAELFKIFSKYHNVWKQIFSQDNRNTELRLDFNGEGELRIGKSIKTFNR